MKTTTKILFFVYSALLMLISWNANAQDSAAIAAMKKAYPGLMSKYGDRIDGQKAHYIFVVDVSNSMMPYESTVKSNFLQFLNAVPDGDQVSLIKMADEHNTGFVGLLKCAELSPAVRISINGIVQGLRFNQNGSDGFSMAKTVIDAINTVGSNDLTFVYMLTDFEYWTYQHGYNKNEEDWASLQSLLPPAKMGGMCKYGIELNSGVALHSGAIFKDELDKIFGKVEYQSVGSAALLNNWFSHIAASVMSVKLNSLLKADWKEVDESFKTGISVSGNEVQYSLDATKSTLVNGASIVIDTKSKSFNQITSQGPVPGTIHVGNLIRDTDSLSFFPSFAKLGGEEYTAHITLESEYADEISRLQAVCGEVAGKGDAVSLIRDESGVLPSAKVWNSILPMWLWVVILIILMVIIASFVYEYAFVKLNREWSISVKAISPEGNSARFNNDSVSAPFTFGQDESELPVLGAPWSIKVYTIRRNPLTFRKSGYYLCLEKGSFADVETDFDDDPRTISAGESILLCPAGQSADVKVRIKEKGKTDYKITLN